MDSPKGRWVLRFVGEEWLVSSEEPALELKRPGSIIVDTPGEHVSGRSKLTSLCFWDVEDSGAWPRQVVRC